jgi:hypothetical protein
MSELSYNFGGIEGAPASGVGSEEILNPKDLDLAPDDDLEESTLVRLDETQEEMTKLGDANDIDTGEFADGGIEHADDWETPIV